MPSFLSNDIKTLLAPWSGGRASWRAHTPITPSTTALPDLIDALAAKSEYVDREGVPSIAGILERLGDPGVGGEAIREVWLASHGDMVRVAGVGVLPIDPTTPLPVPQGRFEATTRLAALAVFDAPLVAVEPGGGPSAWRGWWS